MDKQEKKFIGVWIEACVWESKAINWTEKVLLTEIMIFNKGDKGCFANNKYFADMLDLSEDRISKLISGLKKKGLIEVELQRKKSFTVTKRIITTNDVEKILPTLPNLVRKVKNNYVDDVVKNNSIDLVKNNSIEVVKNNEYNNITSSFNNITSNTNIKDNVTIVPSASKEKYEDEIKLVIDYYNKVMGKREATGFTSTNKKLITKVLKEGYTTRNCLDVINLKHKEWFGNYGHKNLVIATLFAFSNFEKYMDQLDLPPVKEQKKYQQPTQQVTSKEFNYDGAEDWSNPKFD